MPRPLIAPIRRCIGDGIACVMRLLLPCLALGILTGVLGGAAGRVTALSGFRLAIPDLGLDASVRHLPLTTMADGSSNWNTQRLYGRVGYLEGTAWFGDGSNVVLVGHSERGTQPDVFYALDQLQVGARIEVTVNDRLLRYQVTEIRIVADTDISVLMGSAGEQLTLITCDVSSQQSDTIYTRRVVIIAHPVL